jgi:hypothetical protein
MVADDRRAVNTSTGWLARLAFLEELQGCLGDVMPSAVEDQAVAASVITDS